VNIEGYAVKDVVTVSPEDTLSAAADLLRASAIGCVVATEEGQPVGVLTDRDLALAVLVDGRDPKKESVRTSMACPAITIAASARLQEAVAVMGDHGIRRLPVVGADGALTGLVTADDLIMSLADEMASIRSVVGAQSPGRYEAVPVSRSAGRRFDKQVSTVAETATATEVARTLSDAAVGCVVVTDPAKRPVGMITDRDLMERALDQPEVPASEFMSFPLTVVDSEASLEHIIGLMRERKIRRIPVVHESELTALISLDDILVAVGNELTGLGNAFRHAIGRARRDQSLKRLRDDVHATVDWSIGRASELGERAQDKVVKRLQEIRKELRSRL
jgi:CBS domain-containing protein